LGRSGAGGAGAGGAAAAGGASAVSDLEQAIEGDEFALDHLKDKDLGSVRAKINIAIVRKEAAVKVFANAGKTAPPEHSQPIDAAKGISATFEQAYFATFYSVD